MWRRFEATIPFSKAFYRSRTDTYQTNSLFVSLWSVRAGLNFLGAAKLNIVDMVFVCRISLFVFWGDKGHGPRKTRKKDKNYFFKRIGYSVTSLFIFWVFNIEYWFISYNRILKIRRKFLDLLKLGYNEPRSKYLRGSLAVLYVIPNTASYESDIYIQLKDHVCCSNSYIGSKRMVKMKQCRRMASHFMRNTVADAGSALTDARSLRTV